MTQSAGSRANPLICGMRLAARRKYSRPKVRAFFAWSEQQLGRVPGFTLFFDDGRVAVDIEPWSATGPRTMARPAERALRPIGIGRKNWLFAGADNHPHPPLRLHANACRATDVGISDMKNMLADAPRSTKDCHDVLRACVADPDVIARLRDLPLR